MKAFIIWAVSIASAVLLVSSIYAADAAKGRTLFNDSKLGSGATGSSCATCHGEGRGLEAVDGKKAFVVMGKAVARLEDAVNVCIEGRLKGRALGSKSADMTNLIAYIRSLKARSPILAPKKRTAATGC